MATPVVVELDDPGGVCVVDQRHVVVVEVDHVGARVQGDVSGTHFK